MAKRSSSLAMLFGLVVGFWTAYELPSISEARQATVEIKQPIRPLPGHLDSIPVLNSNSPEVVQAEGILVSSLPAAGMANPEAHLGRSFKGRFDIFAHHIARADNPCDLRTLYLGVILENRKAVPVKVNVLSAASYLSQPDAPFIPLPAICDNADGKVFSGPGDRVVDDVLRGVRQSGWPETIVIPGKSSIALATLPIPVSSLVPPLNGRSLLAQLNSSGEVYAATAAMYAKTDGSGAERSPTLSAWQNLLKQGALAGPREKAPSEPGAAGRVVYGRVAGIAIGTTWRGRLTDGRNHSYLSLPESGGAISFPLSAVSAGTFGTGQVQSAEMYVREPDTAYAAHGNYGIKYDISIPLVNKSKRNQVAQIFLQSPIKKDDRCLLTFNKTISKHVTFRGTVRISINGRRNSKPSRYYKHVVLHEGESGEPLVLLNLHPGCKSEVRVEFLYPPDSTPPQVLTIGVK